MKLINILPVVSLIALVTGCAHTSPTVSAPQMGGGFPSDAQARVEQQVVERGLSFKIDASGSAESATVTGQVRDQAAAALSQRGYRAGQEGADLQINLEVSEELLDQFGNFSVLQGLVQASILRTVDRKLVAAESLTATGERALNLPQARSSLARNLGQATGAWIVEAANPTAIGLSANDITVQVPRQWGVFARRADSYTDLFINRVGRLNGVSSVVLSNFNEDQRSLTFRVVYLPDFFPQGILFAITQIDDLNLRP